jgi:putative SOS response-associated peptidase YedK
MVVCPAIRFDNPAKDGARRVGEMRWGFKLPDRLLFNARSDNLTTSPFWKERLNQRCIVPAGSMLEWKKTGTGPRPKYRLSVKGRHILGMAGIWGPWKNPKTDKWEDTFAIITSDPKYEDERYSQSASDHLGAA